MLLEVNNAEAVVVLPLTAACSDFLQSHSLSRAGQSEEPGPDANDFPRSL